MKIHSPFLLFDKEVKNENIYTIINYHDNNILYGRFNYFMDQKGVTMKKLIILLALSITALFASISISYALTVTNYNDVALTNYNVYSTYYALRLDTTATSSIETANLTTIYVYIPYFDGYKETYGGNNSYIAVIKANGYTTYDYTISMGKWNRVDLDQTGIIDRVLIMLHHDRGTGITATELSAIDGEIMILSPSDYSLYLNTFEGETGFGDMTLDLGVFSAILTLMGGIFALQIGFFTVGTLAMIPIGFALFKWLLKMLGKG